MKYIVVIALLILATGCGMEQVDEGYRGIETKWGKVIGDPLSPGLHFYNPISNSISEIDVREKKVEAETEVFTKDTQRVVVKYSVTYYPKQDKIGYLYSQFGKEWDDKNVNQVILGSLKDAIGQYVADDLVSKREIAKATAFKELREALIERHVVVTRLDFTNLDFDDQYEKAVEAKVVAIQRSAEAKNKTVQVKEEAEQRVLAAKADAESMRIKTNALSQSKGLVEYEAIQKWDGKLPEIMMGGAVPIINLDKLRSK